MTQHAEDSDHGVVQLEGIDAVRERPGMFVNGATKEGVLQIGWEILDNAVDEYLAGQCNRIDVEIITTKNRMIVKDWGRGIPEVVHSKTNKSILTSIFTYLHMGGKFGTGLYKYSSGLHGVGAVCTNALSSHFQVESWYNGEGYKQSFKKGVETTQAPVEVMIRKPKDTWSTRISFVPDPDIFKEGIDKFNIQAIRDHISGLGYLCKGLQINFTVDKKKETYEAKTGLVEYIKDKLADQDLKSYNGKIFHFKEDEEFEVALSWSDYDGEWVDQFVNTIHNQGGGRPTLGLRKAIVQAINRVQPKKVKPGDLRYGVGAVMSLREEHPQFKGQTKDELINPEWEKRTYDTLIPPLIKFLNDNKNLTTNIVNRAAKLAKIKQRFAEEKDAMKQIKTPIKGMRGGLPLKLNTTSKYCPPDQKELYLCEGTSAEGTIKKARDTTFQEVLPLRGKFTNAARSTLAKLIANPDISNMIASIGAGLERAGGRCDPKKARVGKVIMLNDADPDGRHIDCLGLIFLMKYMRPVVDAGMVYVIESPLYQASEINGKKSFGYTLAEIKEKVGAKKVHITRLKGWGEINAEDLVALAMVPDTRRMIQIVTSSEHTSSQAEALMGDDASVRKELLGL